MGHVFSKINRLTFETMCFYLFRNNVRSDLIYGNISERLAYSYYPVRLSHQLSWLCLATSPLTDSFLSDDSSLVRAVQTYAHRCMRASISRCIQWTTTIQPCIDAGVFTCWSLYFLACQKFHGFFSSFKHSSCDSYRSFSSFAVRLSVNSCKGLTCSCK